MTTRTLPAPGQRHAQPALTRPAGAGRHPSAGLVDWDAVHAAGRACCCPAKPAVVALIPVAGRPRPTELLLCGHHYRASRRGLAAAGASVLALNGTSVTDNAWAVTPEPARRRDEG